MAQTDQDFELIISDDGSQHGTEEAVRQLDDERVVYLRAPQNRGQFPNIMEAPPASSSRTFTRTTSGNRSC